MTSANTLLRACQRTRELEKQGHHWRTALHLSAEEHEIAEPALARALNWDQRKSIPELHAEFDYHIKRFYEIIEQFK